MIFSFIRKFILLFLSKTKFFFCHDTDSEHLVIDKEYKVLDTVYIVLDTEYIVLDTEYLVLDT